MYFVRKFGSGVNPQRAADPRNKIWAEFHCNICGEDSERDITSTYHTFDYSRERKCPRCGMLDASDKKTNLKTQLKKLTSDKSRIEIEIEKVERELNNIEKNMKGIKHVLQNV